MTGPSYQDLYTKAQTISGDSTAATLTVLKQDLNIGYHRLNAATGRYFTRKQKFASLVADQQFYQLPVDALRVMNVSTVISTNYEVPLTQIRSEDEWRTKNIYQQSTNLATHYFIYGDNQIGIWPKPSTAVSNGLRFVYQPQDVDLGKADYNTGTVSITNGATTVTGSSTVWTSTTHIGMYLQVTDGSDGNWYQIDTVPSNTSLTLVTPYAGPTVSAVAYRLGQLMIIPGEFSDGPVDYALSRFFESQNNPDRAAYHYKRFLDVQNRLKEDYSSSSTSTVITEDSNAINPNPWTWTPQATDSTGM